MFKVVIEFLEESQKYRSDGLNEYAPRNKYELYENSIFCFNGLNKYALKLHVLAFMKTLLILRQFGQLTVNIF